MEFGCYGEIPGCTFSRPDEEYEQILFYDRIILDDGEQITLQNHFDTMELCSIICEEVKCFCCQVNEIRSISA